MLAAVVQMSRSWAICCCFATTALAFDGPYYGPYPESVSLRASVLTNTVPIAYFEEQEENQTSTSESTLFPEYKGFEPDLLRALVDIAKRFDNVTLNFELSQAPPFSYTSSFHRVAADCVGYIHKENPPLTEEECREFDIIVGDYYGYPSRSVRTLLTPPLLSTAGASAQFVGRSQRQITTLGEAQALGEPVCVLDNSHYDDQVIERYPNIITKRCFSHDECIVWLKEELCALFVEDELQLRYLMVQDASLQVTPEQFDRQYILWPINARLDPLYQQLLIRWIYQAKVTGVLDSLYSDYFQITFCPLGRSGINCDQPCSSAHGTSDRYGKCVCESTRWVGDDCSTQVQEDTNLIPKGLKIASYIMLAINYGACLFCALWLYINRNALYVKVSQPIFLSLVLLGCFVSTSTIIALVQEDDGSENGHGQTDFAACMAIPWLYSIGFCITFGSLFAKIRRVHILFEAADSMVRVTATVKETLTIVGGVLLVDVIILSVWTAVDPLQWDRHSLSEDKFGVPLASEGYCVSDSWVIFVSVIAVYHFALLSMASWMCYLSRDIPTKFSEGKYLSLAIISNMQIFVVAVPVLLILGSDSQTAVFVRSIVIWMNDLVVVGLIFGNLIRIQRTSDNGNQAPSQQQIVRTAFNSYSREKRQRSSVSSGASFHGSGSFAGRGSITAVDRQFTPATAVEEQYNSRQSTVTTGNIQARSNPPSLDKLEESDEE